MSDDSTVVVAEYLFRGDAEIALAKLASAGIAGYVRADDEGGLNPGFFSEYRVAVVVNSAEAAAAGELLGRADSLVLPDQVRQAMVSSMKWAAPVEACGLLAGGESGRVDLVFCLTNRAASANRYTIDPREHYGAAGFAERCGLEIVGAWHSHPSGTAELSPTDVVSSPGGEWLTVVIGANEDIRAYRADRGGVVEVAVEPEPVAGPAA